MRDKKTTQEEQNRLNQQLFDAVKRDDLSAVKATVEAGADINTKDSSGSPVLQKVVNNDIKFLKYLLEAGANPDIQDSIENTALYKAVSYGHMKKVKLLLKYKADMYIKDGEGRTPFDISLLCGCYDIAELFISNGYVPSEEDMQKVKNHRLFEAIKNNDFPAVKAAIADGADVNAEDGKGNPLLFYVNITNVKVMRYLLKNGANPNMRDTYGTSLLHQFISEGKIDFIKLLLEFEPNMYLKDGFKETLFTKALKYQAYDIAELFILNGYIPSNKDFNRISKAVRDSLKTRFMELAAQVQEHKENLREETKASSQEFAYADEVIEM